MKYIAFVVFAWSVVVLHPEPSCYFLPSHVNGEPAAEEDGIERYSSESCCGVGSLASALITASLVLPLSASLLQEKRRPSITVDLHALFVDISERHNITGYIKLRHSLSRKY